DPESAFIMNSLFPRELAILSKELDFTLIHFSTDAVFDGSKDGPYNEADLPAPVNQYGFAKYMSEEFIHHFADNYYIFRIPMLFGEGGKGNQFVEKMISRAAKSAEIKISTDIVTSPSYTKDIAEQLLTVIKNKMEFGLYHLSNSGTASLHDVMLYITEKLNLRAQVIPASYKDFPFLGQKNTVTPIVSTKLTPLRTWQAALDDYLATMH
ncbi:MAG: NAD(P)-dependent oxidoreductase, partial [Colwellia sp.]|nr:NAD(P)-dependent oxidoreductase [Colwellia sp.]